MAKKKIKDSLVLTSRDLLNGYIAGSSESTLYNLTPLQMVPASEKDEDWKRWNLDWLERVGIKQLSKESRKMVKNYHLANGILDKADYVICPENDLSDVINTVALENTNNIPIRYFPLVPNVINVLSGEFAKRVNKIIVKAVDETSISEVNAEKEKAVVQVLMQHAQALKLQQFKAMGIDINSTDPKVQDFVAQEMETTRKLVDIENQFKTYRGRAEQWANHIIQLDDSRFSMYQLEGQAFRDMLVADREFWHVKITEDDYKVELWNPINTFYHKSPDTQYISEGNYVGRVLIMSIPDVIDTYGHLMNEEQICSLKDGHRMVHNAPLIDDAHRDRTDYYNDYNKPFPDSVRNVTMAQWVDRQAAKGVSNNEFTMPWHDLNKMSTDYFSTLDDPSMVRVTEAYWKSQRKVGELTRKSGGVLVAKDITVDENYQVTETPVYDKSIHNVETADNLVDGEHVDWLWINEVRWGVKIGSSLSHYYSKQYAGFDPVYIGGDPIPFQFKGQNNLYGCKLPVEGKIFSERNSFSSSLVDKMKPHQVSFNIVNNQIIEMLADEVGNVIMIDQNMIPRNSLNGEWGKHNFPMFHQVMRDFSTALVDTSMQNTQGTGNFNHYQAIDLTKTNQIMSRVELANYFKQQCFEVVGITPQRIGSVAASESATGVNQAVNNSYSQTEPYFDQHMNYLMPRVRQMMIDAAQFVNATKPQSRGTYINSDGENEWFDIEGYRLLLRDFQIRAQSTADIKATVDQLKQMAMQNNTAGGSLAEIAQVLSLNSPAEIITRLQKAEAKRQEEVEAQRQHELQMQQMQQQFLAKEEDKQAQREDYREERRLETEVLVAQIRASQSKTNDVNSNQVPDPLEAMSFLHQQDIDAQQILQERRKIELQEKKMNSDTDLAKEKLDVEREKLASNERVEQLKLKNPVSGEKKKK